MDTRASVQERFGAVAPRYVTSVHAVGPELAAMREAAALRGDERVVDLGCGTGHTALAIAPHVREVVGVDLTAAMLAEARRLAGERGVCNLRLERADVEALPFPDACFDLATCRYAAHHFPDPHRALAEAARVLRPGGRLLLHDVVAPESPAADTFLQTIELLRDGSHVRDHRLSEWQRMLAEAGFATRRIGCWPLATDFDAWVERMATPEPEVAMLRRLLRAAPREAREALAVGRPGPCDFAFPTALLEARREPDGRARPLPGDAVSG